MKFFYLLSFMLLGNAAVAGPLDCMGTAPDGLANLAFGGDVSAYTIIGVCRDRVDNYLYNIDIIGTTPAA